MNSLKPMLVAYLDFLGVLVCFSILYSSAMVRAVLGVKCYRLLSSLSCHMRIDEAFDLSLTISSANQYCAVGVLIIAELARVHMWNGNLHTHHLPGLGFERPVALLRVQHPYL